MRAARVAATPSPLREGEEGTWSAMPESPSPPPSQASGASARRLRDTKQLAETVGVRWGSLCHVPRPVRLRSGRGPSPPVLPPPCRAGGGKGRRYRRRSAAAMRGEGNRGSRGRAAGRPVVRGVGMRRRAGGLPPLRCPAGRGPSPTQRTVDRVCVQSRWCSKRSYTNQTVRSLALSETSVKGPLRRAAPGAEVRQAESLAERRLRDAARGRGVSAAASACGPCCTGAGASQDQDAGRSKRSGPRRSPIRVGSTGSPHRPAPSRGGVPRSPRSRAFSRGGCCDRVSPKNAATTAYTSTPPAPRPCTRERRGRYPGTPPSGGRPAP